MAIASDIPGSLPPVSTLPNTPIVCALCVMHRFAFFSGSFFKMRATSTRHRALFTTRTRGIAAMQAGVRTLCYRNTTRGREGSGYRDNLALTCEEAAERGEGAELERAHGVLALVEGLCNLTPAHPLDEAQDNHLALVVRE